jgi:demethylphylloquinol methyltransferase
MAVSWSGAKPGDLVLDVCCGSGDLTQLLARAVGDRGTVYGVDFSAKLLAVAERRNRRHPDAAPINWLAADALALPFADDSFAAATMGYGLRNVTDIPQCLHELHRVLQPGGKVAILDFHRPDSPVWLQFQQWYLDRWVVPTAAKYGMTSEYAYIDDSITKFPNGRKQVELSLAAGFHKSVHYPLFGGMMGVLVNLK